MKKGILVLLIVLIILAGIFLFADSLKIVGQVIKGEDFHCSDTDKGKKYYVKGETVGKFSPTDDETSHTDFCFNTSEYVTHIETYSCKGSGCSVQEYYCGFRGLKYYTIFLCSNGCVDGACLSSGEDYESMLEESKKIEIKEQVPEETDATDAIDVTELPSEGIGKYTSTFTKIIDFFKRVFSRK